MWLLTFSASSTHIWLVVEFLLIIIRFTGCENQTEAKFIKPEHKIKLHRHMGEENPCVYVVKQKESYAVTFI